MEEGGWEGGGGGREEGRHVSSFCCVCNVKPDWNHLKKTINSLPSFVRQILNQSLDFK